MFRPLATAVALSLGLAALPAAADDVEDALAAALDAYRAGDVKRAAEEASFASGLLEQMKAASLSGLLPEPLDGWTAEDTSAEAQGMALLGGGPVAGRRYTGPEGSVELMLMADSPLGASIAPMLANPAIVAATGGEIRRIAGQRAILTAEGDLMALIANRFLVQMGGSAPVAVKQQYFEAIDVEGLSAF
ncbi:MAG: hypothetical protein AAFZ09_01290 [Pseudomonadota bacterium]